MDESYWTFLGKIDVIFGVLGGLVMIWGAFQHYFGSHSSQSKNSNGKLGNQHLKSQSFQEAFESAYTPIKYIVAVTTLLVLFNLPNTDGGVSRTIAIVMASFIATLSGLLLGIISARLLRDQRKVLVQGAVTVASVFALFATGFDPLADALSVNTWTGPILVTSLIGGILGTALAYWWGNSLERIDFRQWRIRIGRSLSLYSGLSDSTENVSVPGSLVLTDVKKPIQEYKSDGLNVIIKFEVTNNGQATRINPRVKFKTIKLVGGKIREDVVKSDPTWIVHVPARSIQPLRFTTVIKDRSVSMVEDSIDIDLHMKPF